MESRRGRKEEIKVSPTPEQRSDRKLRPLISSSFWAVKDKGIIQTKHFLISHDCLNFYINLCMDKFMELYDMDIPSTSSPDTGVSSVGSLSSCLFSIGGCRCCCCTTPSDHRMSELSADSETCSHNLRGLAGGAAPP